MSCIASGNALVELQVKKYAKICLKISIMHKPLSA